jgi:hypothetical protein
MMVMMMIMMMMMISVFWSWCFSVVPLSIPMNSPRKTRLFQAFLVDHLRSPGILEHPFPRTRPNALLSFVRWMWWTPRTPTLGWMVRLVNGRIRIVWTWDTPHKANENFGNYCGKANLRNDPQNHHLFLGCINHPKFDSCLWHWVYHIKELNLGIDRVVV